MTAPVPVTAAELREAQRAEYGTYVAVVPIDINGARAFNPGDAVPVSHVERGVVRPTRSPRSPPRRAARRPASTPRRRADPRCLPRQLRRQRPDGPRLPVDGPARHRRADPDVPPGKFTDALPVAWIPLGATTEGSTFSYSTSVEAIRVAEYFDPIKYSPPSATAPSPSTWRTGR
jgi:hypothetical protein